MVQRGMVQRYSSHWVEAQVELTIQDWIACANLPVPTGPVYTSRHQRRREKLYDQHLHTIEREVKRARKPSRRLRSQQRIVAAFPLLAATALDLDHAALDLLTGHFLPTGTQLARWSRAFDPTLSVADTIQACRNAWTACGLQALLDLPIQLTPSILAYSLLYPYSDNYLDHPSLSASQKLHFSERFRRRLCGQHLSADNPREAAVWTMVQFIEDQYPRANYPQVFECLLAIHQAQERSLAQLGSPAQQHELSDSDTLRLSCAKGGASVLADACLLQPWLSAAEGQFAFEWGVLLQLGDDLQDVRDDLARGSDTLFTRAVLAAQPLDNLVLQLLNFSRLVADKMDRLPNGSLSLKHLLRASWRSLLLMALADIQQYLTPRFVATLEPSSPFRFAFLAARNQKLNGSNDVYSVLYDAYLEAGAGDLGNLPPPSRVPRIRTLPPTKISYR